MYKIHDTLEVGLNKVTPRALKAMKVIGLDYEDLIKTSEVTLKIFMNEENKLVDLCLIAFDTKRELLEPIIEDLDLQEVGKGVAGFFGQLN